MSSSKCTTNDETRISKVKSYQQRQTSDIKMLDSIATELLMLRKEVKAELLQSYAQYLKDKIPETIWLGYGDNSKSLYQNGTSISCPILNGTSTSLIDKNTLNSDDIDTVITYAYVSRDVAIQLLQKYKNVVDVMLNLIQ